ncbi:MAG: hypothetical protein ACW98K_06915 [Candidatus Kariarchaeaceae archaeon]|jgi:hypothetical protein
MTQPNFDLKDLQDSVIGISRDLIIPENYVDEVRNSRQRSIRKIVDLYHKALEDEEYINVKQRIVKAIDNLESKIDLHKQKDKKKSTFKESLRVLSYTN